jgi:hypothetical protein
MMQLSGFVVLAAALFAFPVFCADTATDEQKNTGKQFLACSIYYDVILPKPKNPTAKYTMEDVFKFKHLQKEGLYADSVARRYLSSKEIENIKPKFTQNLSAMKKRELDTSYSDSCRALLDQARGMDAAARQHTSP